jgi:hypothetical protein
MLILTTDAHAQAADQDAPLIVAIEAARHFTLSKLADAILVMCRAIIVWKIVTSTGYKEPPVIVYDTKLPVAESRATEGRDHQPDH